jgi:hypothetical protein
MMPPLACVERSMLKVTLQIAVCDDFGYSLGKNRQSVTVVTGYAVSSERRR